VNTFHPQVDSAVLVILKTKDDEKRMESVESC